MVSATRLLVLGLLASRGPMHGHQVRRIAEMVNIEAWGDVKVGALYGAIHRLEADALISPVRSEQEGRFPARTVYDITDEGRTELTILRDRALQEVRLAPDPFDVALMFVDAPHDVIEPLLTQRRTAVVAQLDSLVSERRRLDSAGLLSRLNGLVFRHSEGRLQAEIDYLDLLRSQLMDAFAERDADPSPQPPKANAAGAVAPVRLRSTGSRGRSSRERT